jgi:5-dehydro-2-deoxygluconokinase
MFWESREAAREQVQRALQHVNVAVGNVGRVGDGRRRARAELSIFKQGPRGVVAERGGERVAVPPVPVEVVNGLGAGDAFGGALCHGLLAGWELERVMRFANAAARSWHHASPARTPCPPSRRSRS